MTTRLPAWRVTTHQHDTVDALCWRHLGTTAGIVEHVLDLNPGLAAHGPILPHGLTVHLPQNASPARPSPLIHLWR